MSPLLCSVQDTALIGWDHVLDVDERVLASVLLEHFEGLLDQVPQIAALPLAVINLVAHVRVLGLHEIQNRQDLAVVGHQRLANGVRAHHEALQDFERDAHNLTISGVKCGYMSQGQYVGLKISSLKGICLKVVTYF